MCGLNAIFAYHAAAADVEEAEVIRVRDRMAARGPDGAGLWLSATRRVAMGHRRLAIIDPDPRAAQPMLCPQRGSALAYNGEIYNYRALRGQLERSGIEFETQSDTEVLLHLLAGEGEMALPKLRGMFAFAYWDARRGALLLARDPYGIKPLYYADDGWTVRIASQVRALRAGGNIADVIEPAGLVGFLLFGSVPEPFTLWQEIRSVPAGGYLWVDEGGPHVPQHYFSLAHCFADRQVEPFDADAYRTALVDSVAAHMVADVPVGAFLSAGIDSGALVGAMSAQRQQPITAVTIGFDEYRGTSLDEVPLAAQSAARYGVDHRIRRVGRSEFEQDLSAILDAMDQPSLDGFNTWFVSKACREAGLKVAVSGVGADELFGGYDSFRDIPASVRLLGVPGAIPFLGKLFRMCSEPLLRRAGGVRPKMAGLLEFGGTWAGAYLLRRGLFMPWELASLLPQALLRAGLERLGWREMLEAALRPDPGSAHARVVCLESRQYLRNQLLRDTDWASMAHGIEVRTPLVDAFLLRSVAPSLESCARAGGKRVLANLPSGGMEPDVLSRRKTGFSTPAAGWLRDFQMASKPARSLGNRLMKGHESRGLALAVARQFVPEIV